MSKNTHKGKAPAMGKPTNVMARVTITAFVDRPPYLESTLDLGNTLKLMAAGLQELGNAYLREKKEDEPVEDRERKLMGPRGE